MRGVAHRHERCGGMRWTRVALSTMALSCGRQSRVVLTPRRSRQVGDDALHRADDGGKKARSPGRARYKPLKPLRREGRTIPVNLWRLRSCALFYFAREAMGATGTRLSLRPLCLGERFMHDSGARAPRDRGGASNGNRPRSVAIQYSRDASDRTERPQRTGYRAFARYDDSGFDDKKRGRREP